MKSQGMPVDANNNDIAKLLIVDLFMLKDFIESESVDSVTGRQRIMEYMKLQADIAGRLTHLNQTPGYIYSPLATFGSTFMSEGTHYAVAS